MSISSDKLSDEISDEPNKIIKIGPSSDDTNVLQFDKPRIDMGFLQFDEFLALSQLDPASKSIISESRNYRTQHFDAPLGMLEYLSPDAIQEVANNLSNGTISEGRTLTEYTQDTEADDLKREIEDEDGETREIQVNFPVSFRLVKLISSFPTILTLLGDSAVDLPKYIKRYLTGESLIDDSETPFETKKKFIIDWTRINNIFCKQIYRILDNWPIRLISSFTVYTGFNFEIPNVGDFRNSMIRQLRDANEGDEIMLPFVLSTSISPFVAKRFAQNDTDVILQIDIPIGFSIPYISKKESTELEVLLNMFGRYRLISKDAMKPDFLDVRDRVICLRLESYDELENSKLDESTEQICDIISGLIEQEEKSDDDDDHIGGKKNIRFNKRRTNKRRSYKRRTNKRRQPKRKKSKKRNYKRRTNKRYIK